MKSTLAILIFLALLASGANTLLAAASPVELASAEFHQPTDQVRHEGAMRSISEAPRR